jgi:hypothetical protein
MNRQIVLTSREEAPAQPEDGETVLEQAKQKGIGSRLPRIFSHLPGLKEIKALFLGFLFTLLVGSAGIGVTRLIQYPLDVPKVDFVYFYGMGRMFNEYPAGQLYDYELQKRTFSEIRPLKDGVYGPNPHPPFVGVLFRPFARLPFLPAFLLWESMSVTLYLAGLALLAGRLFADDPLRRTLIFFFALAFKPFFWAVSTGQLSAIGFFSFALALREEDRQRPILSGLALSLCMYKPTLLVLFLPMLLITRRYRTLIGFAAGGAALVTASVAVQGFRVWPVYIGRLLSFGTAAGNKHEFKTVWTYVDLASFSAIIPGGRSWLGGSVILGCAGFASVALVRAWWKSRGAGKPVSSLVWATTLTWTLVLNLYVPFYDCILVVLSLIATAAVLKHIDSSQLKRQFSILWILIVASSWIALQIAQHSGFQILTVLFASLGILQLTALRRNFSLTSARIAVEL